MVRKNLPLIPFYRVKMLSYVYEKGRLMVTPLLKHNTGQDMVLTGML